MQKTIKIFTLGCKANQYDSQLIREKFLCSGFQESNDQLAAHTCLINTCTVTQRADAESLNLIRRAKRENPKAKIIVTGCLTELDSARIKQVDKKAVIIKNKDKENIMAKKLKNISRFSGHTRAFLKIQDGCDNFCAYCKVPLVRGKPRSRRLSEIVKEAKGLAKNGFKEIVLTGISLGKYGQGLKPQTSLVEVIRELEKIPGLVRLRLSSIEAGDVTAELISLMSRSDKLCRHLHIPLQSGDNQILKRMNRNYSCEDFLSLIRKIKKKIPGIAITTDVLVGFPGESQDCFNHTLNLIKQISPLKVHIFPFSEREGTAAAAFKDKVNPALIKERSVKLRKAALSCALEYKKHFLGKLQRVLVESRVKGQLNLWEGYTDNYLKVAIKSACNLQNQLLPVKLKKITPDYLLAI
ncbi:MAG: MiaB/RimO family radical SAM methylthiotransferase [Candidatus Omnitrophota bacterium]